MIDLIGITKLRNFSIKTNKFYYFIKYPFDCIFFDIKLVTKSHQGIKLLAAAYALNQAPA